VLQQAEEALRDNLRLLNDIIDGCSPSAIFLKDREGKFITINAPLEKMLGVSREELRGKTDYDLFSKEVADLYRVHDTKVMTTGKALQVEEAADLPDGHHFFLANKFPLVAADGRVYGVGAISHDITERKRAEESERLRAEEALRMSEEEFHSLAEAMPQIVWATRPDGWNIYFNQQWVDYTGMTIEESYGHGWNAPFHPDDKQRAWEAWQRATQHNERYSLECRLRRADGVYRWWLIRGVPLLGANGEIQKWFGTCTDIEDLKGAEVALQQAHDTLEQRVTQRTEQLQQSETLLRGITDSSPDPIFLKDRTSRMLLANPATLAALQKRAEDVLGKTDEEFYDDPAVGRLIIANDRRVMESGQTEVIEEVVPSPTGPRTFLSAKTPYRDADGQVIGVIGIARDITERKRVEEALRESGERYRFLFQSLQEGFYLAEAILDGSGSCRDAFYLDVNPAFERIMGLSRDQIVGRRVMELVPQIASEWLEVFGKVTRTGEAVSHQAYSEIFGKHFEAFVFRPVPGQFGVLVTDITERKLAEEALRASNQELTRFNEAMVGRELRMIELKREVNALCAQLGQPLRYGPDANQHGP
jgi:PAS domain S-box-containing protein